MTEELKEFYERQFTMMATPAWKEFLEDCEGLVSQYKDIGAVTDTQQLFFRKGQLDILNWVIGRRDSHSKAYDELKDTLQ